MTAGGDQPAGLMGERDRSLRRLATQGPEHLATATAACRRCIAGGNANARVTLWQQTGNTLLIVTVPSGAPHATGDNLGVDLALIDRLAVRWGHRGNHHRRTLWALISH